MAEQQLEEQLLAERIAAVKLEVEAEESRMREKERQKEEERERGLAGLEQSEPELEHILSQEKGQRKK